ncbi:MAG: 2OG-Fe(II) oxygenase [Pyrinomonadaceae bacterium]
MGEKTIINFEALRGSMVAEEPFPFVAIENFLNREYLDALFRDFPAIHSRGSYPPNEVTYGESVGKLIGELEGDEFRGIIGEKFDINLHERPTLITFRGRTGPHDGQIHTDTKSKLITVLLYFNPNWNEAGGRIRVLNGSQDLDDYVTEIKPELGTCLIFKVTENCWHGHAQFDGVRRAIQLNYVTDQATVEAQMRKHKLSAKLKSVRNWFRPSPRNKSA